MKYKWFFLFKTQSFLTPFLHPYLLHEFVHDVEVVEERHRGQDEDGRVPEEGAAGVGAAAAAAVVVGGGGPVGADAVVGG